MNIDSNSEIILPLFGQYIYWLIRIGLETALFVGAFKLVDTRVNQPMHIYLGIALAILLSHVPFVLSVTAMDIVLGVPELGIAEEGEVQLLSRLLAFGLELIYLLDNHVALCLLISIPLLQIGDNHERETTSNDVSKDQSTESTVSSFLSSLEPPLTGDILRLEAQEHYVNIVTSKETRLVLYRFSDLLREMSQSDQFEPGMQVHRSHWVANAAIVETFKDGQSLKIRLTTGDIVPVSRSYSRTVRENLKS